MLPAAPPHPPLLQQTPTFSPQVLADLLDAPFSPVLASLRALLSQPAFARPPQPLPTPEFRELTLRWSRQLADAGYGGLLFPPAFGGAADPAAYLAASELIPAHDGSLGVKFGVQFSLWAGSIFQLGTAAHHHAYLPPSIRHELPGCFAMTEIGHGSNVRELGTTAHYDPACAEFVIHTPHPLAAKSYIGNAACHGRIATVFAQLHVAGTCHGVHPFVVPLRDASGALLPGITIGDNGEKLGLNGVDNGRISFDRVRIPRAGLLDRFASVSPDGVYSSPIADPSARFFAMVGTLVSARLAVSQAAVGAAKVGLAIATRYAARRRQFGAPGQPESLLLDYPSHQRILLPRIARLYALHFTLRDAIRLHTAGADAREIETLAAALKTWSTDNAVETLQAAREACGGEGYLWVNRFATLRADADIGTTFEGANAVLRQLVAKNLLATLRLELKRPGAARRLAREQLALWHRWRSPWARRRADRSLLLSADWQYGLFATRARLALLELARAVHASRSRGASPHDAFVAAQPLALLAADAHTENLLLRHFVAAAARASDSGVRAVLDRLRALFTFDLIERRLGWLATRQLVGPRQNRALNLLQTELLAALRPDALALVDAWRIPAATLGAPIALD